MADEDSKTAFRDAVSYGDWRQAESLLIAAEDKNSLVTLRDRLNYTALHKATSNIDFVRLLIDNATDKNSYIAAQNHFGQTALHEAASLNRHEIATLLIENVTNRNECVNALDNKGNTALHVAARFGCYDIAPLLIQNAADKDKYVIASNINSLTALHYAASAGSSNLVGLLIENATDKNKYVTAQDDVDKRTALHCAACAESSETAVLLIQNATDKNKYVTAQGINKMTALHEAATQEHSLQFVKELLRNINTQDKPNYINLPCEPGNRTALHKSLLSRDVETALFLIQEGAKTTLPDTEENTAWDFACTPGREIWEVIIDLLPLDSRGTLLVEPNGWNFIDVNNMVLVNQWILETAMELLSRDLNASKRFEYVLRQVRREFHQNQEVSPHLATREPSCIFQALDHHMFTSNEQNDFVSLVMPFIYIDNVPPSNKDRKANYAMQAKSLKYCVSKDRKFVEHHIPLTLDEYCCPGLPQKVLDARNKDQVLSRYEESRRAGHNPAQAPPDDGDVKNDPEVFNELWTLGRAYVGMLWHLITSQTRKTRKRQQPEDITVESDLPPESAVLIRQVWIWKIGNSILASLSDEIYEAVGRGQGFRYEDKHVGIAILLKHLVELFDSPQSGTSKSILRIYENVLSAISEDINEYVKSVLIEDIDIDKEKDFFHQISDFREELSMIKSVLAEQEEVWMEFMGSRWPNQRLDQQQGYRQDAGDIKGKISKQMPIGIEDEATWRMICRPRVLFNKYRRRITKLEEDAERVERNIVTKLDLKQKHAAMSEAHSTAIISAAVFGFTIITIIFAPLSFIAALFALPIDEFNKGKMGNDKDGVYSSAYIGKWSVATAFVSIAITLLAMWAALRFAGLHVWGKKGVREWIRESAKDIRTAERQTQHESSNANESDGVSARRALTRLGDIVRRRRQGIPNAPEP
ncbi:hypothetical protein F4680DRAFT_467969 [Xylaria scruposa]|nr:hypothetical protein F4680DRAFT_467969 [Xylaria scruposa]